MMRKGKVRITRVTRTILLACVAGMHVSIGMCTATGRHDQASASQHDANATNRPMRNRQDLILTVGQTDGDLQGSDDKIVPPSQAEGIVARIEVREAGA